MKKSFLIATILTSVTGYLSSSPDRGSPGHKQEIAQQSPANASPVTIVVKNSPRGEPTERPTPQPPDGDTAPQWALVAVGIVTCGFIGWQAWESRRATKAMERSSGILMDTEQGRIITYWEQMIHLDLGPKGGHDGTLSHHFNWALGNKGKTQAVVTKIWARFIAIKSLGHLPQVPDYSARNGIIYQGEPLHSNSSGIPQTEWFSTPLETPLSFEEMEIKYRKLACVLYAYGYARYIDLWGRQHETRFGVVRDAQPEMNPSEDTWVVAGPPAYNKST